MDKTLKRKTIYKCYVGSIAHNLYIPADIDEKFGTCDTDTMEFYVYPKKYYIGLDGYTNKGDTFEKKFGKWDMVGHEVRKAIQLLAQGNPNLLVTLYTHPKNILENSTGGMMLLEHKDYFLSANGIKARFGGYAYSQLQRMEINIFNGYMGAKRKKIVEEFGYDTKNAMTCIRLLQEGRQFLLYGDANIWKTGEERELLLDIKKAKYSLQEVKDMAHEAFNELSKAYEKTELPPTVDMQKINKLLNDIIDMEVFTKMYY